jgi:hypothetical protein
MSILGAQKLDRMLCTAKLLLGAPRPGTRLCDQSGRGGWSEAFYHRTLLHRGVIIAIRRKGTSQRKEKIADLPYN